LLWLVLSLKPFLLLVLWLVKDDLKKDYNSFAILKKIEEKQGVFFIHLETIK
jgi:hypothetical protein